MQALLSPEEAAEVLKLKPDTVRGWLRRGVLPGRKLGKVWRIHAASLEAFVGAPTTTQEVAE